MTAMVLPVHGQAARKATTDQTMQIMVNIQAEVLDAEVVRRMANVWLLENAGNLLGAEHPELILGDRLFWRYDVILGIPNLDRPGTGELVRVGQIMLDATTGEVQKRETLAEELQGHATARTR